MQPVTIICDAQTSQGLCGATAVIRNAHYVYRPKRTASRQEFQQELVEARYEIDCPNCGRRTQVERTASNHTASNQGL